MEATTENGPERIQRLFDVVLNKASKIFPIFGINFQKIITAPNFITKFLQNYCDNEYNLCHFILQRLYCENLYFLNITLNFLLKEKPKHEYNPKNRNTTTQPNIKTLTKKY